MPQRLADQILSALDIKSILPSRQNLLSKPGQKKLLFGKKIAARDCFVMLEVEPPSTEM